MKKVQTIYHKDGSVWAKGNMIDGACDGYWEWFRKPAYRQAGAGTIMRSGYFKDGKQIGKWVTYNTDGKEVKVTNFK